MNYKRLTDIEKIELVKLYKTGTWTGAQLAKKFKVTSVAIIGLLNRRGFKMKSQSELQRKYPVNETFFDSINTEHKAYFMGFLYADGYNNTDRNSVNLSLKETDKEILVRLNNLLQPSKPLQYIKTKGYKNSKNQYRLVIANKHISQMVAKWGCTKAKTHTLTFPLWGNDEIIRHFVRGYFDGDGWINRTGKSVCIVSTELFCNRLSLELSRTLSITSYIRDRHPERHNNTRMLEISGGKQVRTFLKWIYCPCKIALKRKQKTSKLILKSHE